jgi:alpha-1,2-mannosyltransferase
MLHALRSGDWITADRIRAYSLIFLVGTAGLLGYLAATAQGLNDAWNRPLGTDFSNVYVAGLLVHEGEPAAPFDPARQFAREQRLFGPDTPFFGWHYPPFFLLVAAALATLPYIPALLVWQGVSFLIYLRSQWMLLPDRLALLAAAAFPAVMVNFSHGHNGLLSAALFGSGAALLPNRPWLAGILLGLLVYKPQFGLLIPIALAAGGHWRAFLGGALTVSVLVVTVTGLWGLEIWPAFRDSLAFTRTVVLEQGGTGFYKIQTMFAWVRLWGGSVPAAYVAQGLLTAGVAWSVWQTWRAPVEHGWKVIVLILACLLGTPYMLDYDLVMLAPVLAIWVRLGLRSGFRDGEKVVLALAWVAPLVGRSMAQYACLPIALWVMLGLFVLAMRRASSATAAQSRYCPPVTSIVTPVTKSASPDARKQMTRA